MISPKNIITSKTPLLTPHDSSTQPVSCVDTRPGLISCKIVTSDSDHFYPPPVLLGNRTIGRRRPRALREGNPAQTRLPGVSARLSDDRELRHAPAARQVATKVAAADSLCLPCGRLAPAAPYTIALDALKHACRSSSLQASRSARSALSGCRRRW